MKEDNTILLRLRLTSRDEEAAVSSSMMIHHPKKIEGARAGARAILTYLQVTL